MRCLKRGRYKYLILLALFLAVSWTFITSTLTNTTSTQEAIDVFLNTNLSNVFPKNTTSPVVIATRNLTIEEDNEDNDSLMNTVHDKSAWMDAIHLAGTIRPKPGALTIGIPTVYRPKESYLHTTLMSLINGMSATERESVVCVIFLSGSNSTYASELALNLTATFPGELRSGFIRLITAPPEYYPSLDHLKITFNDKIERVQWRSRQNLDYAFLVNYAKNISNYYLQIEDDVVATVDFVGKILDFIHKQKKSWAMLDFSGRGFIGKLFRSSDLPKLAVILRVFFNEQPCDFLINYFCGLLLQTKHIVRKPSLFKHIGHYSTLKDQIRKVGSGALVNNPEANLESTIETYSTYTLEKLYDGDNYFWGKTPKIGDRIDIKFLDPQKSIKRIIVKTGNLNHSPLDTVQGAVLEYSKGSDKKCSEFTPLDRFKNGMIDFNSTGVKEIRCLRIRITEDQKEWLMIRKIQIKI